MSVSLRERVEEARKIILANKQNVPEKEQEAYQLLADLALIPTQLTEEEVEKILPKKKGILEKVFFQGKLITEDVTINEINMVYNQAIDDCKSALIGKCATPTFSGEKEGNPFQGFGGQSATEKKEVRDFTKKCDKCTFNGSCNVQKTYGAYCYSFEPIPAEKKCLHRWGVTKELPFRFKCGLCGEEKPIPEKKVLTT